MEKSSESQIDVVGAGSSSQQARMRQDNAIVILGALERIIAGGSTAGSVATPTPSRPALRPRFRDVEEVDLRLEETARLRQERRELKARTDLLEKQNAVLKEQLRARELELGLQRKREEGRESAERRQLTVLESEHARVKQYLCDRSEQLYVERSKRHDLEEALEDVERAHRAAVQQRERMRAERDRAQKSLQDFAIQAGDAATTTGAIGTMSLLLERNRLLENQLHLLETEVSIYRKLDDGLLLDEENAGGVAGAGGGEDGKEAVESAAVEGASLVGDGATSVAGGLHGSGDGKGGMEGEEGDGGQQVAEQRARCAVGELGGEAREADHGNDAAVGRDGDDDDDDDALRLPSPVKSEASATVSMDDESKIFTKNEEEIARTEARWNAVGRPGKLW